MMADSMFEFNFYTEPGCESTSAFSFDNATTLRLGYKFCVELIFVGGLAYSRLGGNISINPVSRQWVVNRAARRVTFERHGFISSNLLGNQ
jgi:hypothetical protein